LKELTTEYVLLVSLLLGVGVRNVYRIALLVTPD
jgi:hypothetical protein